MRPIGNFASMLVGVAALPPAGSAPRKLDGKRVPVMLHDRAAELARAEERYARTGRRNDRRRLDIARRRAAVR